MLVLKPIRHQQAMPSSQNQYRQYHTKRSYDNSIYDNDREEDNRLSKMSKNEESIYRLPPFYYVHVLDLNSNVTRVEIGPRTFVRQDNERVVLAAQPMVKVPPRFYCVIHNPVIVDQEGRVLLDEHGQVQLSHEDNEVRLTRPPFPLYPGESMAEAPTKLRVVKANCALRLRAVLDFESRFAGDEWLFEGPGTYTPHKEVNVVESIDATVILPNQALKLKAVRETTDREGRMRVTGEEWMVKKIGAYLPGAYEEVVELVDAYVLTEKQALHVRATGSFTDQLDVKRRNGEEWLVKATDAETYIPDVYEEVVGIVKITTLNNRQYAVIVNPVGGDPPRPQLGHRRLVRGDLCFFLQPGESLENGIQDIYVLGEEDGLILRASEMFVDSLQNITRKPGDRWMIRGPTEYVPPVQVEVVTRRKALPLDDNEGIYVRDIKTGRVRAVIGQTYMLTQDEELWTKVLSSSVEELLGFATRGGGDTNVFTNTLTGGAMPALQAMGAVLQSVRRTKRGTPPPQQPTSFGAANMIVQQQDEELWAKDLPPAAESLLQSQRDPLADRGARGDGTKDSSSEHRRSVVRDKTKVVTLRVPHNAAVQIYDYKAKTARVEFGPDLVMLSPDEHFTQLSLSGGKPKRPNVIKSLCLLLGPDFCTDIVTVETADHARLSIQLSYNWHFNCGERDEAAAAAVFSVPDFVGDMCKAVASRVRGMVAQVQFDDFHKNSARIIRSSVFGLEGDKVRDRFEFAQNRLVITSVDIQSVEPVDQRTRDSLQKSVQLAIEITTNSQEATAKHEADRIEQVARGRLERQRIDDQAEAENSKRALLELQALSAAVESTGQAKAEAQSRAKAAQIEGEAAVEQARLKAAATAIETEAELKRLQGAREAELSYMQERDTMEIKKMTELAEIESKKFTSMVNVLGADTIKSIATSGPDMQVKLLQSLGLQTTLITDGTSPINLFNTAQGLIGGGPTQRGGKKNDAKRKFGGDDSDE